ncbi:AbrB/MazE/SpoVT family DNA-binding domain-containing protein [Skermanella sp. TT6]|uniref:AbrB/MazE/SpoVT family DNA-binding domain-containing protein n=1 Tax=Skermanella cutis TaxID=2775420 RepID=A0ABX7BA31_9PROT|nr:AbrB/MazE/SpoVT family DNA-binding domain-containing protein [Skermanella sp. TT6]QQP91236.1 AbrB/MazE/SpoVT family DNA-binding domain-containing protein [Skermanella sp. TT6]
MRTEVSRWGNSLAVRLPKQVLEQAGLSEGAAVELVVEAGTVILHPAKPRYDLEELIAGITPENLPESFDDAPVGRELL